MKTRYILALSLILCLLCQSANAFWLWTPQTNKFINPKFLVKDTPEEQYDWAMTFYNAKDYKRAAEEFVRLVQYYKNSKLAPEAQYYAGLSFMKAGKYYGAFQNFQKVVKKYPFSTRMEEIIKLEYELGEIFYNRSRAKLMGMELMTDVERAVEIFTAVVENMPYAKYADNAQFMIGLCQKRVGQYAEATVAFQKFIQEYPNSDLIDQAKYELTQSMYMTSAKADYDQEATEAALDELKTFAGQATDQKLKQEADKTIIELRSRKSESLYNTGLFYEKRKHPDSAKIYYSEAVNEYSDTKFGKMAGERLKAIQNSSSGAKK